LCDRSSLKQKGARRDLIIDEWSPAELLLHGKHAGSLFWHQAF
jgi:hypothetical protein